MDGTVFTVARQEIAEMIRELEAEPRSLTIGQKILAARDEIERAHASGISYARIAARLGVTKSYLYRLLKGGAVETA